MEKIVKIITAECDYIQGHLRGGHVSLNMTQEMLDEFNKLSNEDQLEYIEELGDLNVTDWRVEDWSISSGWDISDQ